MHKPMMRRALAPAALCLSGLLVALATPAAADVKAGVDAWSRGEFKKAVDEWRPAAIAGDADAQFNLGQAYKLGRGVPVDMALAESWYRKAAVQGHVEAGTNYGLLLFQNGKREEALPWLEKSVARGEPRAQLVLGTMLYNGDGVPRDFPRAYALIVRAQASGLAQASPVLAQMDQYVPTEDRQKGLVLARQYEADAQRPQLPPDLAKPPRRGTAVASADLPPSAYAPPPPVTVRPGSGRPGTSYAPPGGGDRAPEPVPVPPRVVHRDEPRPAPVPPREATRPAPIPVHAASGRWRLQLGAFRDEGNARALWQQLKGRVGALGGLQPFLVKSGALTRLQAGPLASSAEATRACAAVRPTGNACVPVAP